MATDAQRKYITDLAVIKTKEFKEVKELLVSNGIVGADAETVANAGTLAEVVNALDDGQTSRFIDVLIATKEPSRQRVYSKKRVERTISTLDSIKTEINDWDFNGLQ